MSAKKFALIFASAWVLAGVPAGMVVYAVQTHLDHWLILTDSLVGLFGTAVWWKFADWIAGTSA